MSVSQKVVITARPQFNILMLSETLPLPPPCPFVPPSPSRPQSDFGPPSRKNPHWTRSSLKPRAGPDLDRADPYNYLIIVKEHQIILPPQPITKLTWKKDPVDQEVAPESLVQNAPSDLLRACSKSHQSNKTSPLNGLQCCL